MRNEFRNLLLHDSRYQPTLDVNSACSTRVPELGKKRGSLRCLFYHVFLFLHIKIFPIYFLPIFLPIILWIIPSLSSLVLTIAIVMNRPLFYQKTYFSLVELITMASSLSSGRREGEREWVTPESNSEFLYQDTCTESPPGESSFSPLTTVEAQEDLVGKH